MINKYLNDIYPNRIWSFHGLEYFVNSDKDYIVVFLDDFTIEKNDKIEINWESRVVLHKKDILKYIRDKNIDSLEL